MLLVFSIDGGVGVKRGFASESTHLSHLKDLQTTTLQAITRRAQRQQTNQSSNQTIRELVLAQRIPHPGHGISVSFRIEILPCAVRRSAYGFTQKPEAVVL